MIPARIETSTYRAGYAILALASILTLYRCRYGVDFTDEAQYVSEAYISLIGGAPFQSELFIQQFASVLLTPLVWIHTKIVGSSEGIVHFFRLLWWVIASASSVALFRRIRPKLGEVSAALVASTLTLFIPFNIPSPSYNSLGLIFLTLGLCNSQVISNSQLGYLVLASLVYPPFGVSLCGVLLFALLRSETRKFALRKAAALGALGIFGWIAAILVFRSDRLRDALAFSSSFGTFGNAEKIALCKSQIPQLFRSLTGAQPVPHHFWVILVAIAGLPLSLFRRITWVRFEFVVLSILCGTISAWASSNGLFNGAIGIFPAFIAALIGLASLIRWAVARRPRVGAIASALVLAFATFCIGYSGWSYFYREVSFESLTTEVTWGPYRGIRTTLERANFLDYIQRQVISFDDGKSSVFFFYDFPAGYLMSTLRPATRMLYVHDREYPESIRKFLLPSQPEDLPDYVFRMRTLPGFFPFREGDPILNAFFSPDGGRYALIKDEGLYSILRKGP